MKSNLIQPIHIKLTRSKPILGLLASVSMVCCWILLTLPIALYFRLVIIALILVSSAYFILRDALLLLPSSWQTLEVDSKGELSISNKKGQKFEPTLAESTFIHANLTILNFKRNGFRLALSPIILFSNTENADALRRLRVWLRWFGHQEDLTVADLAA